MSALSSSWRATLCRSLPLCCALLLPATALAQTAAPAKAVPIEVDAQAAGQPFPHFWERMFGSGHAVLTLRASYRRDLSMVKRATGFDYVRFHGIFDRHVGMFHIGPDGKPVYNFSLVDQIYDGLLARGVKPYVELGFMPR
ncbi:MAG: GH39 family glycosyl hydrolase, partial [Metallibacterium scheffleri]